VLVAGLVHMNEIAPPDENRTWASRLSSRQPAGPLKLPR
jgi:hypothetical protein